MKPERILLPVDVARCPIEALQLANSLATRPEVTVILLHVVNLNIVAPENRVYQELGLEAQWHLERLAGNCLHSIASTIVRVRAGKPDEEILAEATEQNVDLVILPVFGPSWWRRLTLFWKRQFGWVASWSVERTLRDFPCRVLSVKVKTHFNCQKAWGRPEDETEGMHEYPVPRQNSSELSTSCSVC